MRKPGHRRRVTGHVQELLKETGKMPSNSRAAKFKVGRTRSGLVWVLEVRNEPIARSAKTYQNVAAVKRAVDAAKRHAASAVLDE